MTRQKIINITLFLLRIAVAIVFIQAGGVKLFGWFGGMPEGVPMTTLLTVAGILEVFGGALFALGLFTRPLAFILSGEMAFAYFLGHFPMGFWPIQNHGETAFLLCFTFLFFAAYGAGSISLDQWIKHPKKQVIAS
jgi:putative oxidoreductase